MTCPCRHTHPLVDQISLLRNKGAAFFVVSKLLFGSHDCLTVMPPQFEFLGTVSGSICTSTLLLLI